MGLLTSQVSYRGLPLSGTAISFTTSSSSTDISAYTGQTVYLSSSVNCNVHATKGSGGTATTSVSFYLAAGATYAFEVPGPSQTWYLNVIGNTASGTLIVSPTAGA